MLVYRLTKKKYANLEGIGGLLVAGRWHEKGNPVVYFSQSRSLALLEYLVHLDDYDFLPPDIVIITLKIPSSAPLLNSEPKIVNRGWEDSIHISRGIGTDFLKKNEGTVLQVPTVIVPGEYNFIVNPLHEGISKLKIVNTEAFILDPRITGSIH